MGGPCLAWAVASVAIGQVNGTKPMPPGLNTARVGRWDLAVNAGREPVTYDGREMSPFELQCVHTEYLAVGAFDPAGGAIGGYSEDRFIKDILAELPPEIAEEFSKSEAGQ
jgi:hypothetical protein